MPFAQALRLRRICSTNNEFQDSCDTLCNKLIERGYKQEINKDVERTKAFWTDKSSSKRKQKVK